MPLSELALTRALERIGVQAPVRFDEVTRSTQLTARSLAEEGAPEWTLVAAAHQTEGRGRLDRRWIDEPGRALMFSMVLRPDLRPERGGLIPLLAGWALAVACREVAGVEARCKWPNDLLVGEGKAGGILVESVLAG
ncbi:MAG: biotin--[acetyl-CoA-carboxylase] ligase, partial [Actinomycetota bacterium]